MEILPEGSYTQGHNAEPINSGICCTDCNNSHVLSARIKEMFTNQFNPQK